MAHGFLSYQDTRGEVDYLGGVINAVKKYLDNREKKEKVADIVASKIEIEGQKQLMGAREVPSIHGTKQKLLTGGSFSRLLSSPQLPGAPGSGAVNPTVMGGALANIGFAGKPLKPDGFVSDQVIDVTAKTMAYGTEEIVQAVDRLTFVNIQLLAAVRQQTALVNRDITRQRARNEENLLEKTIDSSGNVRYSPSRLASGGGSVGGSESKATQKAIQSVGKSLVKRSPQAIQTGSELALKGGLMTAKQTRNIRNTLQASRVGAGFAAKTINESAIVKTLATGGPRAIQRVKEAQAAAAKLPKNNIKKAPKRIGVDPSRIGEKLFPAASSKSAAAQYKILREKGISEAEALTRAFPEMAKEIAEVGRTAGVSTAVGARVGDTVPTAVRQSDDVIKASLSAADGPLAKMIGKGLGKSLLKKIPVIAGVAGIVFGIQRALEGDFLGAGLEITSGILGATGVGGGLGLGIDGFLLARDLGVTPFSAGGIITKPTMGLVGETGQAEGVFPLEGSQGRKTFQMFGDAFVDAQVRRKKEVAQVQAEGLMLLAKKRPEYMKVFDMLNPFNWGRDNNGGGNPQTPPLVPPPPLPSSPGGSRIKALRNFIGRKESGNDYSKLVGGAVDPSILSKSVAQLTKERGGLFAMGRYQIQMRTANEMLRNRGIDPATFMFDQAGQDSIFNMLLERRKYGDFLSGRISKEQFGRNLAQEWAALPYSENNSGYYDGVGSNRSLYKWNDSMKFLEGLKNMGDQSSNINSTSMQTAMASMPGTTVINNTYVTGDGKSSGGNAPAAVPIGIGSRDTGTSAFSDLSIRTLV